MVFYSILVLIVAIALPSINKNISSIHYPRIISIVLIYAGVLSFNALYIQSIGSGIGIYSGLFQVSAISQLLDIFIFIIGALILVAWPSINNVSSSKFGSVDFKTNNESTNNNITVKYGPEYSIVVLFSTLGASLLVSSADLISMYLSIELQSFGVYILSTLYRDSESATSAGLKYFLLGCLSSCLILLGAGLIYAYTGLTNFESIYNLVSVENNSNIILGVSLGFIIIFVGFLFKISAAPLHNWAPDVYDDTPTIVTIWLTIMPKISIVIFLLELYVQLGIIGNNITLPSILDTITANNYLVLKNLLLISSLLSLIIGTVVGLAQTRIKRLLTYSTISHVGFILLALAINTEQSIDSLIFYIIQYSLTNLNTFLIVIALGYIINKNVGNTLNNSIKGTEKDIKFISELKGQFFSNPLLSLALTVCLFSMAGVPPLMGFFGKQFVLYSAIQSGYYFLSIVGILVSIISASYYLKIIRVLHTESTNESENTIISYSPEENTQVLGVLSNYHSFLISSLTLSIIFFVLKPSILLNSTQLLSLTLFNY
jgi:NADH-ubiquinone oxidoreductase chain 2